MKKLAFGLAGRQCIMLATVGGWREDDLEDELPVNSTRSLSSMMTRVSATEEKQVFVVSMQTVSVTYSSSECERGESCGDKYGGVC